MLAVTCKIIDIKIDGEETVWWSDWVYWLLEAWGHLEIFVQIILYSKISSVIKYNVTKDFHISKILQIHKPLPKPIDFT